MAERKSFTITWRIKNFSYCWQKDEEELSSPTFFIEGLQGSKWTLLLYPRASKCKEWGAMACYLHHIGDESDAHEFEIAYELSVLDSEGIPLETMSFTKHMKHGDDWSEPLILQKYMVFLEKRSTFLPKDSLTVRCRIWQISQENTCAERYLATTRIEVQKVSLFGVVVQILEERDRYNVKFISASSEASPIHMNVYVMEGEPYADIKLENSELMKFCKWKFSFTDDKNNKLIHGQDEFLCNAVTLPLYENSPRWRMPLMYMSKFNVTQPYFEMDNLTLRGEIEYSTGVVSEKIQKIDYSINMFQNGCRIKEKRQEHLPSLKDDLLFLMQNTDYSDIKLLAKSKTFFAHRNILSARSPFFKTKLADKNIGSTIYIDDMDDEILHLVLLFIYTDSIENLEVGNALDLYIASAQLEISSLKHKCSSLLQNNLDSSICCDVLRAADKYQDSDLKKTAQNYILEHADEVFGSDKWQVLEKSSELTEEIEYLKRMKSQEKQMHIGDSDL